jgi:hypothetical protein
MRKSDYEGVSNNRLAPSNVSWISKKSMGMQSHRDEYIKKINNLKSKRKQSEMNRSMTLEDEE